MAIIIGQDPDYYARQSERMGLALRMITESKMRREAREDAEVQRYMTYLAEYPQLADTVGVDMVRRYGRKRPELASLVSTLQNDNKLQRESETQLDRFSKAYADEISRRQKFYDTVESMPDEMPMSMGLMGPTVSVPNTAKQAARSQQATMANPEWSAFAKMSPDEQYAVMVAMRRNKIKVPEAPETLGPKDLSEAQRGLAAAGYGNMSPEMQRGARIGAKLEESPASIQEREARTAAEEARNEREKIEEQARFDRNQEAQVRGEIRRADLADQRITAREAGKPAKQTPEEKKKEKNDKQLVNSVLEVRVEGSQARKDAMPDKNQRPKVSDKVGDDFETVSTKGSSGPPPALPLRVVQEIRDIALDAAKAGAPAEVATARLLDAYDQMQRDGVSPQDALKILRSKLQKRLAP